MRAPTMKSMSETDSEIRQPLQRRSQEAYARVLQAGREILEEEGIAGFTVQAVSKRAGVSVGSIYLRAPSREALLLAIHAQEMDRMDREEVWLAPTSVPPGGARAHIEQVVTKTSAQMLANAGILRAFMRRGPEDPEIFVRGRAGSQRVAEQFEAALLVVPRRLPSSRSRNGRRLRVPDALLDDRPAHHSRLGFRVDSAAPRRGLPRRARPRRWDYLLGPS